MPRSLLFVPAHAERLLHKAHERGADAIILDLEDGVPATAKDAARAALAQTVPAVARNKAMVFVRINADTRQDADARAACMAGADGLLVPKARDPQAIQRLTALLTAIEAPMRRAPVKLVPVMEDPGAVLDARALATASPRVYGLLTGGEDLATAMDAESSAEAVRLPKMLVHLAAKAAGVLSFGLLRPIADYRDLEGITASVREARALGFDGATCVHPSAVRILNAGFLPDADAIAQAQEVLAAATARGPDAGAFEFAGRMVDEPVLERARRLLARAGLR